MITLNAVITVSSESTGSPLLRARFRRRTGERSTR